MSKPLKVSQVDLNKIIYQNIKGKYKKYIPIDYETSGSKLIIQTPLLMCNSIPVKSDGYFELDIPLYGKSSRKVDKFVKLLKLLDLKFINDAKHNAKKWFTGKSNIRYKSIFRDGNDNSKIYENGFIKIKMLTGYDGTIVMQNGKEIRPEQLVVNNHIRLLLEINALWLSDEGFGLYIRPHLIDQVVIQKYQFSFIDDSESESDILDTEIGPGEDEGYGINPFVKDSETSIMSYDTKKLNSKMDENQLKCMDTSNSDRLKTENDTLLKSITETNDESTFDSSLATDFNNSKK